MADSDWELSQAPTTPAPPMDGPEIVVTANTPGRLQGAWKDVSQATSDQPNEIATGDTQTVAAPNLAGVNDAANAIVHSGGSYDQVVDYLTKRGAAFQPQQLQQAIEYQAKHPEYRGQYFDLENQQVQMNPVQKLFNAVATNPTTAPLIAAPVAAADAEAFGQLGKISKPGADAGIQQLSAQNPGASMVGQLAGGVAQAEGAGELLGLAGVPALAGSVAQVPVRQLAADVAIGAGQGATEDPDHPIEGAIKGALTNVIAGRAMGALGHGEEAPTEGPVSDNVNPHLSDEGNAQLQQSLRQGDRITAESVLHAEGQPVTQATRDSIGHAIDYYRDGGTEDMGFTNGRVEPSPHEVLYTQANDAYENAKDTLTRAQEQNLPADQILALNKNVDDAYDHLMSVGQGDPYSSPMNTKVPDNPLAPDPTPEPVRAPEGDNQQTFEPESRPEGGNQQDLEAAINNHQPTFDSPEYQKLSEDFRNQIETHAIDNPNGSFQWFKGPAKNLADYMASAFHGHAYGPIAAAVSKSLQKMEDVGMRNEWTVRRADLMPPDAGNARGYAGENPFGVGTEIALRDDSVTPETTLHELLHATVTRVSHAVDFINAKGTDAQKRQFAKETTALKGLREVNRVVNNYLREHVDNPEVEKLISPLDNTNFLQNEQELMAWGMTNPRAQKLLASIPMGKSTAFTKFLWGVQRLLGMGADSQSALTHLITHTGNLLEGESGEAYRTADSLGTRPRLAAAQDNASGDGTPSEPAAPGDGTQLPHDELPISPENPPHPDEVQAATERVTEQLTKAIKNRNESEGLLRDARAAQLNRLNKAIEESTDQSATDRYSQARDALKGKADRAPLANIRDELDPKDIETLGSNIWNTPSLMPAEKFRAFGSFQQLLDGEHLQPAQLLLLNRIFPTKLISNLVKSSEDLAAGRYGHQREMFRDSETLSTGPVRELNPEPKPVDPDKYVYDKNQGELFPETRVQTYKDQNPEEFKKPGKPKPEAPEPKPDKSPLGVAINNVLRGVMASSDMSGLLNQGAVMAGRKSFWSSIAPGFKSFGSEQYYNAAMDSIRNDDFYPEAKDSGLFMAHIDHDPNHHEEAFMANLGKVPVFGKLYNAGERGYNGLLNKIRFDGLKNVVENYRAAGVDVQPEDIKALAHFINSATGRGDIKFLKGGGQLASTLLFAPRYLKSRVDLLNPFYYAKLAKDSPLAAKYAAGTMVRYFAGVTTILGIAQAAGAQVQWDPRSTDFAKIKVGNIRFSPLGAFQPLMRVTARVAPALVGLQATKLDSNGNVVPLDGKGFNGTPLTEAANFARTKLGPLPGLIADKLSGTTVTGDPFNWTSAIASRIVPLWIQDAYDGYQDSGAKGAAATGVASFLGVPTQTYQPHSQTKGNSNWKVTSSPTQAAPTSDWDLSSQNQSSDWDMSSQPTQAGDWSVSNK